MEDYKNNLLFNYFNSKLADEITENGIENTIMFLSTLYSVDESVVIKYKELYGNYPEIPFDNTDVEMIKIRSILTDISRTLKINKIRKCI